MIKLLIKFFLLFVLLSFNSNNGLSQTGHITIEFIGNCALHLTDGEANIYIDFPYKSGAFNYMKYDAAEIDLIAQNSVLIFTHNHTDHRSIKEVRKVRKKKNCQVYGVSDTTELEKLGESITDFKIEAFKTKHVTFGLPFRHYSYLITWHGRRIYLSGDTTYPDTISTIKNIDWAFVPEWIIENAIEQGIEIDADLIGVYHLSPAEVPGAKARWDHAEYIKPMVNQGEVFVLDY